MIVCPHLLEELGGVLLRRKFRLVSGDKDLTTLTGALPPVLSPAAFLAHI